MCAYVCVRIFLSKLCKHAAQALCGVYVCVCVLCACDFLYLYSHARRRIDTHTHSHRRKDDPELLFLI